MEKEYSRKSLRYPTEKGTVAEIDLSKTRKNLNDFTPSLKAEVFEEAHKGCGLIADTSTPLRVGSICQIKIGHLGPLRAKVRWKNNAGWDQVMLGIEFLD